MERSVVVRLIGTRAGPPLLRRIPGVVTAGDDALDREPSTGGVHDGLRALASDRFARALSTRHLSAPQLIRATTTDPAHVVTGCGLVEGLQQPDFDAGVRPAEVGVHRLEIVTPVDRRHRTSRGQCGVRLPDVAGVLLDGAHALGAGAVLGDEMTGQHLSRELLGHRDGQRWQVVGFRPQQWD